MSARHAECDVLIVGGGIVGLWCRALLEREGYSTLLVERGELGGGQSIASQGILHAGLKYLMSGEDDDAPRSLAEEHGRWLDRLARRGWPDLSGVEVLAEKLVMWTTPSLASRATGWLASPMMRSRVRRLERDERPVAFREAPRGFGVWEVDEPAIDARSLIERVAAAGRGPMLEGEVVADTLEIDGDGVRVQIESSAERARVRAGAIVLAAGRGNAGLLRAIGQNPEAVCQERPLHMVIARHAGVPVFGHCVRPSMKPRLTITSGADEGGHAWYVGGAIAEPPGTERDPAEQIEFARRELGECLPWLDRDGLEFGTLRVSRAEGLMPGGGRPEGPVLAQHGRIVAVWPTKLAMAPSAGERVLGRIGPIVANPGPGRAHELEGLPAPRLAGPVWTWSPQT